jgi:histidinol-phosphate aminotransferase
MSWQKHLRPSLEELEVYDVAPSEAPSRMHANECPERWPEAVREELGRAIARLEFNRYPDTSGRGLRAVLAHKYGVDADRIVLGNGSDEIISILLTTLSGAKDGGHLVIPTPTFVMYAHSALVLGVPIKEVPLDDEFQLQLAPMREALEGAALCFFARPNNPTSSLFNKQAIETLVAEFPHTIFVLDEAYAAYLGTDRPHESIWTSTGPDNLVLMSTLSKVGLAALRLGYGIANPELALAMNKVRHPYNISTSSLTLAELALSEFGDVQDAMIAKAIVNRSRLEGILGRIRDARLYDARGNLVLCRLSDTKRARALVAQLADQGVRIKDVTKVPGLAGCIRVSIGTDEELDHLESALRELGELD